MEREWRSPVALANLVTVCVLLLKRDGGLRMCVWGVERERGNEQTVILD